MTIPEVETPRGLRWVSSACLVMYAFADPFTETQLSRLYECRRAFAVSTGMTALDMILRLVAPGDVIIAGDDIYGGTDRLLTFTKSNGGADVRHIDMTSQSELDAVLTECKDKVKMVLIETPTNPLLKVLDIKRIADSVHGASPVSRVL